MDEVVGRGRRGRLFPDADSRARIEAEQQQLPLSYFEGVLPIPAGWSELPGAYVAFGDTYAEERSAAVRRGWPVQTLPGTHLHMLSDPDEVATALVAVLGPLNLAGVAG